jgi:hypothetical protein
MKNLTNLLEDVCSYFCEKYGNTENYVIRDRFDQYDRGKVYVLSLLMPTSSNNECPICLLVNETELKILPDRPSATSDDSEIISINIGNFGGDGTLDVSPPDVIRGYRGFRFYAQDKFSLELKMEFLNKINELYYSGKYSYKLQKEPS